MGSLFQVIGHVLINFGGDTGRPHAYVEHIPENMTISWTRGPRKAGATNLKH